MKFALLGMGTVGGGVYDTIRKGNTGLCMKRVLDRRALAELEAIRTENIEDILADPEIEAVVECMGGLEPAYSFVCAALRAKKHVVSSNKHLISTYFRELHELAAENGVALRYTAAAGGGIPWLFNLARARRCDEIRSIEGVINGTTNFILDGMHERGASFDEMLKEAQRLGYAEADPSADIDGLDTRRKCALSASLAFDGIVREQSIPCAGIRGIRAEDIAFCESEGRVCRLMFRARMQNGSVDCAVMPVFVPKDDAAAHIHGCDNIVRLKSRSLGALSLTGAGAGAAPTGTAVVQDLLDIASGAQGYAPRLRALPIEGGTEKASFYLRRGGRQYVMKDISLEDAVKEGADFFAQIKA